MQKSDWSLIPEQFREPLRSYFERGENPGAFLFSIIIGDFFAIASLCEAKFLAHVADVARFFREHAPEGCWGSLKAYERWQEVGGMFGLRCRLESEIERLAVA
jgi:hypothetical protein